MIFRLYKKLKRYNIIFKKNEPVDILLLDERNAQFKFDKYKVRDLSFSEINLYYFIPQVVASLITKNGFLEFRTKYLTRLFNSFNSKLAIGHHITGHAFTYKKCMPDSIAINYQFCRLLDLDFQDYYRINKGKKLISDYFFVYDLEHLKKFSAIVEAKYIIAGSLKNNEIILETETKKYDIMYISEYRGQHLDEYFIVCHEFAVRLISEYCKLTNKTFCIALSSSRPDKAKKVPVEDELNYYRRFAEFAVVRDKSSYEIAALSNLCISISSNLGTELLSRNIKVFFLPLFGLLRDQYDQQFLEGFEGPFWYKGTDKEIIFKKIDILFNMSSHEWEIILKASNTQISFDPGNKILKQLVNDIMNRKQIMFAEAIN